MTVRLGPEQAALRVHTGREGVAAAAGHDLVLEVTRWEAAVSEDGVELKADPRSLVVRDAHGGPKPLTSADHERILRTVAQKLGDGPITFRSTEASGPSMSGELTIAGTARPILFDVDLDRLAGRAIVRQTDFGITPHSAMMGALRVADEVEVTLSGLAAR